METTDSSVGVGTGDTIDTITRGAKLAQRVAALCRLLARDIAQFGLQRSDIGAHLRAYLVGGCAFGQASALRIGAQGSGAFFGTHAFAGDTQHTQAIFGVAFGCLFGGLAAGGARDEAGRFGA